LARYYLNVLEKQKGGEKEPELVPNANEAEVNLEHVLPQNPSAATWVAFDEDARSAFTHRLGNLALMKVSSNSESGTEEFPEKKKRYAKSGFLLTKIIGSYSAWTGKEIEDRQSQLAALALGAWPQKP